MNFTGLEQAAILKLSYREPKQSCVALCITRQIAAMETAYYQ